MSDHGVDKVVVVGSGQAGVEVASHLRQHGFAGSITVVGEEPFLPYQRPPLSKEFLKSIDDAPLPLKGEAYYEANAIDLRLGIVAMQIDRRAREVVLDDGNRLGYDHLVLATGARNRFPPVEGLEPSRVLELRTLAHARAMLARLDGLRHVTIIGGGFIGLEVAALLRQRDVAVDVLEAADRLMSRVLSPMMSEEFRKFHISLGTRLRLGTIAARVSSRVDGFTIALSDGMALDTDAVIVAAGVVPNSELAAEAGLTVSNGVIVNERLLTSDPSISAVGDCAAHPNPFGIGMIRLESVQNAVDQARTVAARISGDDKPYHSLPWFWSHQGSYKLQIAGLAVGADDAVLRGDPQSGRFSVFIYRGDRLIAVESVNAAADHMVARRLLTAEVNVSKDDAANPGADLKAMVPR